MAQNALWASNLFSENTKVAVWAHNGHIMNEVTLYETGSMGYYLKEELSDNYQIVDFAFSFGSFNAIGLKISGYYLGSQYITQEPIFGSINYIFHHTKDDNFILRKMDIIVDSDFDNWISESQRFLDIGAAFYGNSYTFYHLVEFKEQYDVLIYWDITSASELLFNQNNNFFDNIFAPNISSN